MPLKEETVATTWRDKMKINRNLLPLKLLLVLMFGAMSALYPFMTIHMVSLGLTYTEIAVIYSFFPLVSFIGPLLGGFIADKIGNYRLVFVIFTVFCVVNHLLIWFAVPSALPKTIVRHIPLERIQLSFLCSSENVPFEVLTDLPLNGSCDVQATGVEEMTFSHCWSSCNSSKLCLIGSSLADCFEISAFEGRHLSKGFLQASNNSFVLGNFSSEENQPVKGITCITDETDYCHAECGAMTNINLTCQESMTISGSRRKTLILYVIFRYLAGIGMSTISPILDAIAYQMSKEHHGDLGVQRAFTLVGMAVFPPLSGYLIDLASKNSKSQNFSPAFIMFGSMLTISAVIAYFMNLKLKLPAEHILKNVRRIISNPKVTLFIVMMFFTGCFWGFLENFLFVFMDEIGSSRWLNGMTATVSALSALPVVACSTIIMKYLGHTKIIAMCAILYGVRFICYSFIYDPFLILPVEILEAFTTSLLWVVASVYCGKVAPDYLATLQGIFSGAHSAIGRGIGSLVGGIMFDKLTKRPTYQIWGAFCIIIGIVYLFLHFCWLRKIFKRSPEQKMIDGIPINKNRLSPEFEKELENAAESAGLLHVISVPELTQPGSFENLWKESTCSKPAQMTKL